MYTARVRLLAASSCALSCVLLLAAGAQARKYSITGPTRALVYNVPGGLGTLPLANPPGVNPLIADQMGSGPATLTLPAGVFDQHTPQPLVFPVGPPLAPPSYVQFASSAVVAGPTATAMFSKDHWMATRAFASFKFCPGAAANPNCTTGASGGGQGTRKGRVQYIPGANNFGGTMKSLMNGSTSISVITATSPTTRIRHIPLNLNIVNGRPYASKSSGLGPPAQITTGGVRSAGGIITQPGNIVSTVAGFTRTSTGFPFTTGKVIVTEPGNPPSDAPTAWTATGADFRTPQGAGNIQMVAGMIGYASANGAFGTMETIKVSLIPLSPVPSMGRVGLAMLGTLLAAGGYLALRWRR